MSNRRSQWLVVAAVLAAGLATVVFLAAWNTDISSPARGTGDATRERTGGAMPGMDMPAGNGAEGSMAAMTPLAPGANGLTASSAGLTLVPRSKRLTVGRATTWRFSIRDAAGRAVTRFQRDQTKLLHLIVVRRDLAGYQHLHPALARDGEFSIPINVPRPGRYRAIADFTVRGKRHVLGVDLTAPGHATKRALLAPSSRADVAGYRVGLDGGKLAAGQESDVTFTVSRDGRPVRALQPYLGADGHLVALRAKDLAYVHVHPTASDPQMGTVRFAIELPKRRARYRLFFQFKVRGVVRTAAFTADAS
jgi:hypothetical protein